MKDLKSNVLLCCILFCIAVYIGVFIGRMSSVNNLFIKPIMQTNSTVIDAEPALININQATLDELMMIPEMDVATAKLIIQYRNETGDFVTCIELTRIDGISYDTYLKFKPYITVGGSK